MGLMIDGVFHAEDPGADTVKAVNSSGRQRPFASGSQLIGRSRRMRGAIICMSRVAETVDFGIYKQGYFSPSELRDPLGIIPAGPEVDWQL